MFWIPIIGGIFCAIAIWALADVLQKKHAIIHNFPIIGHLRYWLETIGPELRQYIVTNNNNNTTKPNREVQNPKSQTATRSPANGLVR